MGQLGEQSLELLSKLPSIQCHPGLGSDGCFALSFHGGSTERAPESPWDKWLHQDLPPKCPLASLQVPLLGHVHCDTPASDIHPPMLLRAQEGG